MRRDKFAFLALIFILFLQSRFLFFGQVPASVYWDEASIGYNAYSVMLTGKDESGESLPLHFRAFGEFKLPVYVYSVIPFIKIFGLTSAAVRIPAVIYSGLSVMVLYLFVKQITNREIVALLASFLFAISKWFFIFSRTGYEATAGLFFFLLFLLWFLKSFQKVSYLPLATLALLFSMYSYNSFRLIGFLIFIPFLVVLFRIIKDKRSVLSYFLVSVVLFVISLIPIYKLYAYDTGLTRLSQVQSQDNILVSFTKSYFSHLTPSFLFFEGDSNLRSNVGFGELYKIEIIFLLFGLVYVFRKKKLVLTSPLLLLLAGLIPAAITKEYPHALRSIAAAPFFSVLSAYGIYQIGQIILPAKRKLFYSVTIFFLLLSFENYQLEFFVNYPQKSAPSWQYQYRQVFDGYKDRFDRFSKVVITPTGAQPYIFALFYTKYDPALFLDQVVYNPPNNWGFSKVERFGKFEFTESSEYEKGTLVFTEKESVMGQSPNETIYYPDDSFALNVFAI